MSESNVIRLPIREPQQQSPKPSGELTIEQIRAAEVPTGKAHRYLFCPVQKGFGVYITARGVRTYFVQARSNGKVQRRTLDNVEAISIKEARRRARQLRAGATLDGRDISKRIEIETAKPKPVLSFAAAWQQFRKERPLARRTQQIYQEAFDRLTAWHERDFWTITKAEVSARFIEVLAEAKAAQASQTFRFFGTLWKYHAADLPVTPASPTLVLTAKRLWPKPTRKTRLIDAERFPQWWHSLEDTALVGRRVWNGGNESVWALYFRALALTGCRKTEMLNAEWSHYDAKRREWHFPATITKNRHAHTIPVGPKLAAMLEAHRKTQEKGTRFLFAKTSGRRFSDPAVHSIIWRHRVAHGSKWSPHDLRRTYATIAHDIGVPPKAIKMLLNHRTGDVTDGYIHPEELRGHQERIETAIFKRAKIVTR